MKASILIFLEERMISDFEEIISWQKAQDLTFQVYNLFKNLKDYWFKDQIQRAWVSISNNIAEWFERKSNNEFRHFLYIAKWSCWEFRSLLIFAKRIGYLSENDFTRLYNLAKEISKLIYWLIKTLK